MILNCPLKTFREAVHTVGKLTSGRSPSLPLQCVHVDVTRGRVKIQAMGESMRCVVEPAGILVVEEGTILLPYKWISDILSVATNDLVITTNWNAVEIKSGKSNWKQQTPDESQFPMWTEGVPDKTPVSFRIKAGEMSRCFKSVVHAADVVSTKYAFGGVSVTIQGESEVSFVALDGRRIAVCAASCEAAEKDDAPPQCVVPVRATSFIQSVLDKTPDADVLVKIDGSAIYVIGDGFQIRSSLVEGRFPAWRKAYAESLSNPKLISSKTLLKAVECVSLAADETSSGVDIKTDAAAMTLVCGKDHDAVTETECGAEGVELDVRISSDYLRDALRFMDDEIIEIGKADPLGVYFRSKRLTSVISPQTTEAAVAANS